MESNNAMQVPVFADAAAIATLATFGAFKVDERISFIRNYDPKVTNIPMFRHAVIRYRNTDKNTASKPAKMVTIQSLKLPEEYSLLPSKAQQVILGCYEDEQDNIIKAAIEAGATTIGWDLVSLDAVLDSLTAAKVSQRLTKEQIEAWFKVAATEACTQRAVQISQEKGYNAEQQAKQVAGTINAYCNIATALAAPVPNIGEGNAKALKNLLIVSKLDDDMAKVLLKKLEAILNPKVAEGNDL